MTMTEFQTVFLWIRCTQICEQMNWKIHLGDRDAFIVFNHEEKYVTQFSVVSTLSRFLERKWKEYSKAKKENIVDPLLGTGKEDVKRQVEISDNWYMDGCKGVRLPNGARFRVLPSGSGSPEGSTRKR